MFSCAQQIVCTRTDCPGCALCWYEKEQPQEQPRPSRGERRAIARAAALALSAMLHDDATLPMAKKPKKPKKASKSTQKSEEAQLKDGVHYTLHPPTGRRRAGWAVPAYVGVSLLPARGGAHLRERSPRRVLRPPPSPRS